MIPLQVVAAQVQPSRKPLTGFSLGCWCVCHGSMSFSLPHLFLTPILLKVCMHFAFFCLCPDFTGRKSTLLINPMLSPSKQLLPMFVTVCTVNKCFYKPLHLHHMFQYSCYHFFSPFSSSLSLLVFPSSALSSITFSSVNRGNLSPQLLKYCVGSCLTHTKK